MYLIAKQTGGYQAIPIKARDKWDFHKLTIGMQEIRIIFRLHGRRYLLYHTRELPPKYPGLRREHLVPLCDEIIAKTSECIERGDEYIDFEKIAAAAECRHQRRWREQGLISPATPELYHGHPIDGKAEQLVSYVQVSLDDIVLIDHEPQVDCDQEELPY
jgi:hypothetical protein